MARTTNTAARPAAQQAPKALTTSILVGNLHCPSCVTTIRDALHKACPDHIRWVSPNIVTSLVTVEHDAKVSYRDMVSALLNAGFDICSVTSSTGDVIYEPPAAVDEPGANSPPPPPPSRPYHLHDISEDADEEAGHDKEGHTVEVVDVESQQLRSAPGPSWVRSVRSPLVRWMSGPRPRSYHHASTSSSLSMSMSIAEKITHAQAQAHLRNCTQCRQLQDSEKLSPTTTMQLPDVATLRGGEMSSTAAAGDFSAVVVEDADTPSNRPVWRANLAIGGMTCAVCVNAITDGLKKRDWISKVTVNLISNSATVEFDDKTKEADIVEAIDDIGYDATIDSVVCLNPPKPAARHAGNGTEHDDDDDDDDDEEEEEEEVQPHERTVEIYIDGLDSENWPGRVADSLEGLCRPSLQMLTKPTPQKPIIKLQYVPDAPAFTIRHILAAIEASDSALAAHIHHPLTLEQRSKMIQRKHQQQILYRLVGTCAVGVPSLIIGIVIMSLLPASSHLRMHMMAPWVSGISRAQIALFVLATPVYFFAADLFHVRAYKEIRTLWRRSNRTPLLQRFYRFGSMNTLMSLGTTIAYFSSVGQMIAAGVRRAAVASNDDFYFDSVVFLTLFLLAGRLIESYSKSRTGDAVEMLCRLRPTTALLAKTDDTVVEVVEEVEEVQADQLDFGDVVRVLHGGSPPADGVVVQGSTNFDESSLTGESRLVPKTVGDKVFSGTVNKDAPVLVKVTGTSGTSMLDQIVAVVREGQTKRAPMEQIADLLTTYFVPIVTLIAIVTWLIWLSLGVSGRLPDHYLGDGDGGWVAFSLKFAISVFVVACPCGLGLAAPTAIFVAGGIAAEHGILAKGGGEAFEKASRIDCVVFDKTGTLTMGGEPTVTDFAVFGDDGSEMEKEDEKENDKTSDLLAALKAVEENSSHPVAKAIVGYCTAAKDSGASRSQGQADNLKEMAGRGMRAVYNNKDGRDRSFEILVGNEALLKDHAVAVSAHASALLQKWKTEAKSVALAATRPLGASDSDSEGQDQDQDQGGWVLSAAMAISDPVRPEAASILAALQARGVDVYMLSGDNAVTAVAVAQQLGIPADQVIAEVLPTEKAAKVKQLQASLHARTTMFGRRSRSTSSKVINVSRRAVVAMVGDGINDAPALTQADVAIAVGSGSDVAISSADFVLVKSNLQAVMTLLDLSRCVFHRIALNFGWALVYNAIAVPVAAGALYPIQTSSTKHVRLDPAWASLAMALSSISVVLSSLALRSRIPGVGFRPTVVKVPSS